MLHADVYMVVTHVERYTDIISVNLPNGSSHLSRYNVQLLSR